MTQKGAVLGAAREARAPKHIAGEGALIRGMFQAGLAGCVLELLCRFLCTLWTVFLEGGSSGCNHRIFKHLGPFWGAGKSLSE